MTNYYEELDLDRNKGIDEINKDLNKLESKWVNLEKFNEEKSVLMRALIIQARKVFTSDTSRRNYDNDLDNSLKYSEQIDPDKKRRESFKKWRDQALSYSASRQYDLAKAAIEKAISFFGGNEDDDSFFALASDIFKENEDLQTALSNINKAIVIAPEISGYYLSKGLILSKQASDSFQQIGNPYTLRMEARKMFQMAEIKASQNGDLVNRARACGILAFSFYFNEPTNKYDAEKYATLAEKYGGDSWGNASKVLDAVKKQRQQEAKTAEESRRAYEEQRQKQIAMAEKQRHQERIVCVLKVIFAMSLVYLLFVTVKTLYFTKHIYDGFAFRTWIEFVGPKLCSAFLIYGLTYGFLIGQNSDDGGFFGIILPLIYIVVYTFFYVKYTSDYGGIIGLPFCFIAPYLLSCGVGWVGMKISSFCKKHSNRLQI